MPPFCVLFIGVTADQLKCGLFPRSLQGALGEGRGGGEGEKLGHTLTKAVTPDAVKFFL